MNIQRIILKNNNADKYTELYNRGTINADNVEAYQTIMTELLLDLLYNTNNYEIKAFGGSSINTYNIRIADHTYRILMY